jgi:hypothetical protein
MKNNQIWQSPGIWITAASSLLLMAFVYLWHKVPRAIVMPAFDVSNSAQIHAPQMIEICQEKQDRTMEGDYLGGIKFADLSIVTRNAVSESKQVSEDCSKIAEKPAGIGKTPGTDLENALSTVLIETQHLRTQGNKLPLITIVAIDAAEPKTGQKPLDTTAVKAQVQAIAKEGYITIIGPEAILQSQLSKSLVGIPNVKICSFEQGTDCGVKWAFDQVRKYPWQ